MKRIDLKSFRDLIDQVLKEEEQLENDLDHNAWIPSEPDIKDLIRKQEENIINSKLKEIGSEKGDQVSKLIDSQNNIKVGKFLIKILKRRQNGNYDVSIYYYKNEKLIEKISILKDKRFEKTKWIKHFDSFKRGLDIPQESVLDMIKWFKAIDKLTAFI